MLAAERRRIISERIKATGQVVVSALSAEYEVSEETIRRDLEWLEKEGIAVRIYGGAVLAGNDRISPPYSIRKNTNVEPKVAIARLLSLVLKDGDTLMVDESSTAAYAIRAIRHLKNITLITNSLELLRELTGQDSWHVISTGGTLKPDVLAQVGPHALRGRRRGPRGEEGLGRPLPRGRVSAAEAALGPGVRGDCGPRRSPSPRF